jgi:hypothetical protein
VLIWVPPSITVFVVVPVIVPPVETDVAPVACSVKLGGGTPSAKEADGSANAAPAANKINKSRLRHARIFGIWLALPALFSTDIFLFSREQVSRGEFVTSRRCADV